MVGEYDEKFEEITVVLQKMQKSVGGLDELRLEVRDMRKELRDVRNEVGENTASIKSLGQKVDILSGQFGDVGGMAIKDHQRIDNLEERVDVLEAETH